MLRVGCRKRWTVWVVGETRAPGTASDPAFDRDKTTVTIALGVLLQTLEDRRNWFARDDSYRASLLQNAKAEYTDIRAHIDDGRTVSYVDSMIEIAFDVVIENPCLGAAQAIHSSAVGELSRFQKALPEHSENGSICTNYVLSLT